MNTSKKEENISKSKNEQEVRDLFKRIGVNESIDITRRLTNTKEKNKGRAQSYEQMIQQMLIHDKGFEITEIEKRRRKIKENEEMLKKKTIKNILKSNGKFFSKYKNFRSENFIQRK